MATITVDVWLYGPLRQYGVEETREGRTLARQGNSYANLHVDLPTSSCVCDLLASLSMPTEERGITFINGSLSAMPGLQPDLDRPLQDGDRAAFFHLRSMWPFQYRHGAARTPELARAMDEGSRPFHHRATRPE